MSVFSKKFFLMYVAFSEWPEKMNFITLSSPSVEGSKINNLVKRSKTVSMFLKTTFWLNFSKGTSSSSLLRY